MSDTEEKRVQLISTGMQIVLTGIILFGAGAKAFYDISSNKEQIKIQKTESKERTDKLFKSLDDIDVKVDHFPFTYVQKADFVDTQKAVVQELKELGRKIDAGQKEMQIKLTEQSQYIEADYNRRMDKLENTFQEILKKNK